MTAGLFLVPAANADRLADGLTVTDARRPCQHRHLEAFAEPFGDHAQVHLALAPDHHLMAFGIVVDAQRRVFVGQLDESLAELDVVLAFLGLHGDRQHRRIRLDRRHRAARLPAR